MADNRNGCVPCRAGSSSTSGGSVIIDTSHVFDSCRDRDCFEDVAVFLSFEGQEIIEHTNNIRVAGACILWSNITLDPVRFNRGFYEVTVRFYVKLEFEACMCAGRPSTFYGIAVVEKSVILYGGEGNVSIFKSSASADNFCTIHNACEASNNLPTAVVEVVEPVILNARVIEPGCACNICRCCFADDIPENICGCLGGCINNNDNGRKLVVSLGFFSVIRIERPEQYLINAVPYSVPDKECFSSDNSTNPCELFKSMEFPINEFQSCTLSQNICKKQSCPSQQSSDCSSGASCGHNN